MTPFVIEADLDRGSMTTSQMTSRQLGLVMGVSGPLQASAQQSELLHNLLDAPLVGLFPGRKKHVAGHQFRVTLIRHPRLLFVVKDCCAQTESSMEYRHTLMK